MLSVELRLFHDRSSTPTPFAKNQSNDSIFIPSNVFCMVIGNANKAIVRSKKEKRNQKFICIPKITLNEMNKHRLTFTEAKKATERF